MSRTDPQNVAASKPAPPPQCSPCAVSIPPCPPPGARAQVLVRPQAGPNQAVPFASEAPTDAGRTGPAPRRILLVTSMTGASECAALVAKLLRCEVDGVGTRREALAALRGVAYDAVVVDDAIAESDPGELLRKHDAVVVEVNFAICGGARVAREVSAAIARRRKERALAIQAGRGAIEAELRGAVASLLLQSQLALAEVPEGSKLVPRLQSLLHLVGVLRRRLEGAPA